MNLKIDSFAEKYKVAAFYCFEYLSKDKISSLNKELNLNASKYNILGTIIIASEGINGTICGNKDAITKMKIVLEDQVSSDSINFKFSYVKRQAFRRFKVKNKVEIVTMGVEEISPNKQVGNYIEPNEWNEFISNPDTIIIDTRNEYEIGIGTFKGSLNPHTDKFRDFPNWVEKELKPLVKENPNKSIGMFCTGGIRCEKATSLLLKKGFSKVHHLHGGILRYLEIVPEDQSLWQGECFVFDQRVSLNHQLSPGDYLLCFACGMPLDSKSRNKSSYIKGVQCHYCKDYFTDEDRLRFAERQKHYDAKSQNNLNF